MGFILRPIAGFVAMCWLALAGFAQFNCSILPGVGRACHGPEGDAWMLPFFTAPLGLPALMYTIVTLTLALVSGGETE